MNLPFLCGPCDESMFRRDKRRSRFHTVCLIFATRFPVRAGVLSSEINRFIGAICPCAADAFVGWSNSKPTCTFSKFVKCHCSRCRNATGSAFAANAYVSPPAFRWLSGEDNVARFDLSTARSFSTSFCRNCGSPLPHATRSGREIIMPAGSLRDDPGVSPTIDTCWQSRAQWLSDAINLPKAD